ncbi:MAG: glycine dehydrogenase (aminomethyl-transferring) [Bacteroidetes bacterium]|nr:MAG: glycine dehydrogenase (aminomethyl-transferring) [Bacteroidota bacterium]
MQKHPDSFLSRHIGPSASETAEMLQVIGVDSLEELIAQTVPASIRLTQPISRREALSEHQYLRELRQTAALNQVFKSYIGQGYYDTVTPSVILRNIFENPGWYTAYTPYQAEISQGRQEALLNYQTMVCDLTGLPVANASLLDEATAAGEALSMTHAMKLKKDRKSQAHVLLAADTLLPQTLDVLRTRASGFGLEVRISPVSEFVIDDSVFAAIVQYPDLQGAIHDYQALSDALHAKGCYLIVAADLLSLTLLKSPGEFGADVALGSAQRLGVPMGFGGPHAAFFAAKEEFLREMPGRIIGVSIDAAGNPAMRMTLQTREQHIRRDKATSNICTAQALLAIMASMYGVYHGPDGLKGIALYIHRHASILDEQLRRLGLKQINEAYFDTLTLQLDSEEEVSRLRSIALAHKINFRYDGNGRVGISIDETTQADDIHQIIEVFAEWKGVSNGAAWSEHTALHIPEGLARTSAYMTHPVFHSHRSETAMMRYIKSLENKDLALNTAMIPLGSCTMKLNAATELIPVSWPEFSKLHPFVPAEQAKGYELIINELGEILCEATGFAGVSFQPNSGAQGEYAGLMVIRAWHQSRGDFHRNVALIPSSAHGTNPASAVMAGMKVVVVGCDDMGNIDMDDLRNKAIEHSKDLSCLMITYPSTHGVFEETVVEACKLIHELGGQVYMDGANMNAQVGLTSPGFIGADVCHLNLHKTFAIPHGGGGPGMGPICVVEHLRPFLPGHVLVKTGGEEAVTAVSATPFGSASILLISYAYAKMLGGEGLKNATEYAILNANYMKERLEAHFQVLFQGANGRVAHEFILDLREFKQKVGLEVDDLTKRLIDYGFHAPTVSWPVPGTIMIEPTESEPKFELDRFCDALISIREEIREIELGLADMEDNVLRNSPHTLAEITADEWPHKYGRQKAAFPAPGLVAGKFWPAVKRVNNTYGDRHVVCTCPPIEAYATV